MASRTIRFTAERCSGVTVTGRFSTESAKCGFLRGGQGSGFAKSSARVIRGARLARAMALSIRV